MKGKIVGIGGLLVLLMMVWPSKPKDQNKIHGIATIDKPNPHAEKIPDIKFTTLEGKPFTRKDLEKKTTILFFFNPLCHHCKKNAKNLVKHADKFKDVQVILFSTASQKALEDFNKAYKIDQYDNFQVMHVAEKEVFPWFGSVTVPSTFIYNKHHEVVQKIIGNTFFDFILSNLPA